MVKLKPKSGIPIECKVTIRPSRLKTIGTFTVRAVYSELFQNYVLTFRNRDIMIVAKEFVDDGFIIFHN